MHAYHNHYRTNPTHCTTQNKKQKKNKPSDDMRDKIDINIEGLLGKALKL